MLNKLKKSKFFRIFKVNLDRECPFWDAEGTCFTSKCAVGECSNDEIPDEWMQCNQTFDVERYLQSNEKTMVSNFMPTKDASEWMRIEEHDAEAIFVNLNVNQEAMTYFNGSHIWRAIYNENCFSLTNNAQCKEDHILYKLISGIHANVNMHITHFNYDEEGNPIDSDYDRYYETVGKHEDRIENMLYTYAFVLQAVNMLSDKVDGFSYIVESPDLNKYMKKNLNELIELSINTCEVPYQQNNLFELMDEGEFISNIKPVFYNITRILDCVTCEKCRLHGKLQFTGMTAVMKILFAKGNEARLTRNEMVGLINLLTKLSNSVKWYQEWLEHEETTYAQKKLIFYATIGLTLLNILVLGRRYVFKLSKHEMQNGEKPDTVAPDNSADAKDDSKPNKNKYKNSNGSKPSSGKKKID